MSRRAKIACTLGPATPSPSPRSRTQTRFSNEHCHGCDSHLHGVPAETPAHAADRGCGCRAAGLVGEDAVMRVRFAGSGDAFGSGGRWQTCIHLSGEGQVLLVDCGVTSLVALKAQGLDPDAVDSVAVTHLHGDHFGGLPFLILDGQFSRRAGLGGASFACSGDTQWTPVLAEAAHGADLFAVEACTFDRPVRYHLDHQAVRAHLGQFRARRIVLTHMSAAMLTRLADAEMPAAYDGMTLDL